MGSYWHSFGVMPESQLLPHYIACQDHLVSSRLSLHLHQGRSSPPTFYMPGANYTQPHIALLRCYSASVLLTPHSSKLYAQQQQQQQKSSCNGTVEILVTSA